MGKPKAYTKQMRPYISGAYILSRHKRFRFFFVGVFITGIWWFFVRSTDTSRTSSSFRTSTDTKTDLGRANKIREAYMFSWKGYERKAFGFDELLPVTGKGSNSLNGWGATIVDGLSTSIMMEFPDIVRRQLVFISKINFSKAGGRISLFETTIRYMGGMLSAYDLLKGPYKHLLSPSDDHLVDALLIKSIELADMMKCVFDTKTGIPHPYVEEEKQNTGRLGHHEPTTSPTSAGSLILEWMRLSDLTENPLYGDLTRKAMRYLIDPPNPDVAEPYPGLIGTRIRIKDGRFQHGTGGWGAESDSYYEYLLKMYIYDPIRFGIYKDKWVQAAESTIKYLARPSPTRSDLTFVADFTGHNIMLKGSHLACFLGGNFILGGETLNRPDFIKFGLEITKSCHATYVGSPTRLGPENWKWSDDRVSADSEDLFRDHGFYVQQWEYKLRPEVIESYYHAYVSTGNGMYKNWAWDAFEAIEKHCKTTYGYSSIRGVKHVSQTNMQESFWFAETLKYLYLIFTHDTSDGPVKLEKGSKQKWVFNTEAHPMKVMS